MDFFSFYTSYLAPVPAFLAGIYSYSHLQGGVKWVFWFAVFGTMAQWSSRVIVWLGYYNIGMLHFYVPVEFFLLSMAYVRFLDGFVPKRTMYSVVVAFLMFCLIYSLIVFDFSTYHGFVRAISSVLLSVFAILTYMKMLNDMKIVKLQKDPLVWINTAVFFLFSGSFFVFITFNAILNLSWELSRVTYNINTYLTVIFYLLVAAGFLKTTIRSRKRGLPDMLP